MAIRLWIRGPRLPFGLRAGISIPVGDLKSAASRKSAIGPTQNSDLSYVYVIAGHQGAVKVGYSTNPQMRLAALQTASAGQLHMAHILATDIDARMIEAEAHRLLDRHRLAGEWFDVSPEVAIEAVELAARNMGLPVVSTDTDQIARAVAKGEYSLNPDKTKRMPSVTRFFYLLLNLLGLFMTGILSIWALTDRNLAMNDPEQMIALFLMFLLLAVPLFLAAWLVRRHWRRKQSQPPRIVDPIEVA